MVYNVSDGNTGVATTLDAEKVSEITEAILDGKYSWACFLLLRDLGYEPSEYIAYRTYYRLIKEHRESLQDEEPEASTVIERDRQFTHSPAYDSSSRQNLTKIKDLAYLERVREQPVRVRGGEANQGFSSLSPRFADFVSKISQVFR
ncbi:HetP family heterocyst commitment protein [Coleofasciculus sp. G2-EDA-02]|uniref:HetP family heterocyst commitment protein n=1 Tax=Coleofasciculus sp. G2-EDA-02 TaxID=3069529 RepID=UPI0032F3563F